MEPIPFPSNNIDLLQTLNNRRVKLLGRFEHENEFLIDNKRNKQHNNPKFGSARGFHVFTPFILSDSGHRILVNRGWLSSLHKEPYKRALGQIEGETEFNAFVVLKESMPKNWLADVLPSLILGHSTFDLDLVARQKNIDPTAIFIADSESTVKFGPQGGQSISNDFQIFSDKCFVW